VPINRDVHVGNERETAFEQLLHDAIEPDGCRAEAPCRLPDTPQGPQGPQSPQSPQSPSRRP
jgi:hypothetical protein